MLSFFMQSTVRDLADKMEELCQQNCKYNKVPWFEELPKFSNLFYIVDSGNQPRMQFKK